LKKRSEEVKSANDKLDDMHRKLGAFADLTPDVNLARIQVEQLKDEITRMENQITDNISNLNAK